jgi:hypothetical protein
MWKAPASVLVGCLAALPLIGCAGNVGTRQQAAVMLPAVADTVPYYTGRPHIYAAGPAAVLVFLPATGPSSGENAFAGDPALWAAQGFDVVMPQPAEIYRLVADQDAALARLVASARTLGDAPIWLVGPSPVIDAALATPQLGHGGVSGIVVTSVTSNVGSCSESVFYADPGNGAAPKVEVRRSEDYAAGARAAAGRYPSVLPAPPANSPEFAAHYRGIRRAEEFVAGRKSPAPRPVDQRHAAELTGDAPAVGSDRRS